MDRRYPEVRYDPSMTEAELRHQLARRSVFQELRDAFQNARKRAD